MPAAERPADELSVVALAAGIGALVLLLFSVLPFVAPCLVPLSALSAALALITGIASLIRTTLKPELEGRYQALAGIALALVWGAMGFVVFLIVRRYA
ncbi:MAG: hypothetical protein QM817_27495 [Archangium sp.]